MEGHLRMSAKERRRLVVLSEWQAGRLKLVAAAEALGVSYRHARRIGRRYRQQGAGGLVHRLRGRPGGRRRHGERRLGPGSGD
ncbi:MAG: helix-turn-helix domain-containing protein [Verrucomicrobia bacterium]|nr:helix-turn-helix domain-containing protein [Verrucomicrobiota bacterium]